MERRGVVIKYSISVALMFIILIPITAPVMGNPDPDTVFLTAVADAKVDASAQGSNFGGEQLLVAGRTYEFLYEEFLFIKFDISSIPAGSIITDASIPLI